RARGPSLASSIRCRELSTCDCKSWNGFFALEPRAAVADERLRRSTPFRDRGSRAGNPMPVGAPSRGAIFGYAPDNLRKDEYGVNDERLHVLMVGPGLDVAGGISAVVNHWLAAGLGARVELRYIATLDGRDARW